MQKYWLFFLFIITYCTRMNVDQKNSEFQTGIQNFYDNLESSKVYSFSYDYQMGTLSLNSALGIMGIDFGTQDTNYGWRFNITTLSSTSMSIEGFTQNNQNNVTFVKFYYMVSSYSLLHLNYTSFEFVSGDAVFNASEVRSNFKCDNTYLSYRSVNKSLPYTAKNTANKIRVIAVIVGFSVKDVPNITGSEIFGINLQFSSYQSTSVNLQIYLYGDAQLVQLYLYYISYEQNSINEIGVRKIYYGSGLIGCTYSCKNCSNSHSTNNDSFSTEKTEFLQLYENLYFIGFNQFIITNNKDTVEFIVNATTDTTKWKNSMTFSGNDQNQFTIGFNYLMMFEMHCPSSSPYQGLNKNFCYKDCNSTIQQYADSNKICRLCNEICYQCNDGTNISCTSCYVSHNRILSSGSCICNSVGFYDDGANLQCEKCHHSCHSCSGSSASQCINCQNIHQRFFDGNSCPCKPGYYDANTEICLECHYSCDNCSSGNANSCTSCLSSNKRTINSISQCPCDLGWFDNNAGLCVICLYTCWTCNNLSTKCTSCNSTTQFRQYNSTSNTCQCSSGYFDHGEPVCGTCKAPCVRCEGPLSTDCLSCSIIQKRQLQSGQCNCMQRTYQNTATLSCQTCHYSCFNCSHSSSTSCLNCNEAVSYRLWSSSTNQCKCKAGYVDYSNTFVCVQCNYTCKQCSNNKDTCTLCDTTKNRQLLGNSCPCKLGWVDTTSSPLCQACHFSCLDCQGGTSNTHCKSCNMSSFRNLTTSMKCICPETYYDTNITQECLICHQRCKTCYNQNDNDCITCENTYFRIFDVASGKCICQNRYYHTGALICASCHFSCLTCTINKNNCTSCDQTNDHRKITANFTCDCISGFYEINNQQCSLCHNLCKTCSLISNNCTSCFNLRSLSNNDCVCIDGYYQNSTQSCQLCHYSCLTCSINQFNCLSCQNSQSRFRNGTSCPCKDGYYDNNTKNCVKCHYTCLKCKLFLTNVPQCTQCLATSNRILLSNGSCQCISGYYNSGVDSICRKCSPYCVECSDYSVCTACNGSLHRSLSSNSCHCVSPYFDDKNSVICQSCHSSCATCFNGSSTSCLSCSGNRQFLASNKSCPCKLSYYENTGLCYQCSVQCASCHKILTNCTSCSSEKRILISNTCKCKDTYYDNGGICDLCQDQCNTCTITAQTCLSCNPSHGTILKGSQCLCSTGFYKQSLICHKCHYSCLNCTASGSQSCSNCLSTSHRYQSGLKCLCEIGYYENGISVCSTCDSSCMSCSGLGQYNCTSCNTNRILIGTYCRLIVTCINYNYESQCVDNCPLSSYPNSHECIRCINRCATCLNSTYCLTCVRSSYLINNTCALGCPQSTYADQINLKCSSCPQGCTRCLFDTNQIVCLQCATNYYRYNDSKCVSECLSPYFVIFSGTCYPCFKQCKSCSNLSSNGCLQCQNGYNLYQGSCRSQCPLGYYVLQKQCQSCDSKCIQCTATKCQQCIVGYYPSLYTTESHCIPLKYYLSSGLQLPCHPNCLSCTDSSFSSCISCELWRGDHAQMAVSGYCDCWDHTIDLGNGQCDRVSYQYAQEMNEITQSSASAVIFSSATISIMTMNFIPVFYQSMYQQTYSQLYYLNSSAVLQIDQVLQNMLNSNINHYFQSSVQSQAKSRLLLTTQTNESLFMRGQKWKYLFDWAFYTFIIIVILWITIIINYFYDRCISRKNHNRITNNDTISQNRFDKVKKQQNLINSKTNSIRTIIFNLIFQNILILIHILTITEIMFYGLSSFKIIFFEGKQSINITKMVLSMITLIYYLCYLLRLIIGAICCNNYNQSINDSLSILTYQFCPEYKLIPLRRLYLPFMMSRNCFMVLFLVTLSSQSSHQIIGYISCVVIFELYSLLFCPYKMYLRLLIHLHELLFVGQIGVMLYTIIQPEISRLQPTKILIILNLSQLLIFIFIPITLIISMICCTDRKKEVNPSQPQYKQTDETNEMKKQKKQEIKEDENKNINIFEYKDERTINNLLQESIKIHERNLQHLNERRDYKEKEQKIKQIEPVIIHKRYRIKRNPIHNNNKKQQQQQQQQYK